MKNDKFEKKPYHEILVDCKDEYEQNMSWFYYVQDELEFPFEAETVLKRINGKNEVKKIKVLELSTDDSSIDRILI